ncbi:uncharacterized protein LOC142108607 [Mixophyes fleayi]|uniref:uncharacterized protein LOC142108607 n=1 Tax=Mixophyes fleayi TaxID=3061075 RepID=UPI003F4E28EE
MGPFIDPFPAPFISLSTSHQKYTDGEPIAVTCAAAGGSERRQIQFYINEQKILFTESLSELVINEIVISVRGTGGKFSCNYRVEKLGRWIDSRTSEILTLSVSDSVTEIPTVITPISQTSETQTGKDENIKTSPTPYTSAAEYTAVNAITMPSVYSTSKQDTNDEAKKTSPATHISTDPATFSSISQQQPSVIQNTSKDHTSRWIHYSIAGSILFILLCVAMIVLLFKFCLSKKGKKAKVVKANLWMNSNTQDTGKSRKASPLLQMPLAMQVIEEQHLYTEIDLCPTIEKSSPTPRPSKSVESLVYCLDSCGNSYSNVQAIEPLTPLYYTPVPQRR